MKKLIVMLMLAVTLAGCGSSESDVGNSGKSNPKRFVSVETTMNYLIMVDKETMVMYMVSSGIYNHGTFTVMVDKNGKPLTWEGDLE